MDRNRINDTYVTTEPSKSDDVVLIVSDPLNTFCF